MLFPLGVKALSRGENKAMVTVTNKLTYLIHVLLHIYL